jgi:hypothetical protein
MVGFRLSRSLWLSRSLFLKIFFSLLKSRLSRSLFHKLYLKMGFRLSRSLSRTFLSHDGIEAIKEPFTNFSFSRWNRGYHRALLRTFVSHDGIEAIRSIFTNFSFLQWNRAYNGALSRILTMALCETHTLGEDFFHIYHKGYLHRICLIKNLAPRFMVLFAKKIVRSSLF